MIGTRRRHEARVQADFSRFWLTLVAAVLNMDGMKTLILNPGDPIVITDANGEDHPTQALSGVEVEGHNFPVVWVSRPLSGGGADRAPWPAAAVRPYRPVSGR